jgi:transglutaminase-like putative cysteine protease
MKWEIKHTTRYEYAFPVRESFNDVRVTPFSSEYQEVKSFFLKVLPATRLQRYSDFYGNVVHHFEIPEQHKALHIESNSIVETKPPPPLAEDLTIVAGENITNDSRCFDFLQPSRYVDITPETWRVAMDATADVTDLWQQSLAIMRFVHKRLVYQPNSTRVHTHMREVLEQGCGVCQDYAHVMLGFCRCLKIPAQYISGYLATETASATHAWVEVYVPGVGWRGLDPTHNRQIDATYIKLGNGRDYHDVSPVTGYYKGTLEHKMNIEVKIRLATLV